MASHRLATLISLAILALNLNLATSLRALEKCRASGQLQSKTTDTLCNTKNVSNCCKPQKAYPQYHCSPPVKRNTQAIMTFNSFTNNGQIKGPSISKGRYYHLSITSHEDMSLDGGDRSGSLNGGGRYGSLHGRHEDMSLDGGDRYGSLDGGHEGMSLDGGDRYGNLDGGGRYGSLDSNGWGSVDGNRWGSVDQNGNRKGPSKCGNKYYSDKELVVALSTGWYNGGSRCQKNIRIKANRKSVVAKVVDECDSVNGCDSQHGFRLPCANNVVVASPAVWKALGIPKSKVGNFQITWSDV